MGVLKKSPLNPASQGLILQSINSLMLQPTQIGNNSSEVRNSHALVLIVELRGLLANVDSCCISRKIPSSVLLSMYTGQSPNCKIVNDQVFLW